MFLTSSNRGYTRDGQQKASGGFLVLFSHNEYKWATEHGKLWWEFPQELRGKLYAHVCQVSMTQCGNFMMGKSLTLLTTKEYGKFGDNSPKSLILSGTYGGDGLGCDYEDLTPESRRKLVEVPADLATQFWKGGGWNEAGSEGPDMARWAVATFIKVRSRVKV